MSRIFLSSCTELTTAERLFLPYGNEICKMNGIPVLKRTAWHFGYWFIDSSQILITRVAQLELLKLAEFNVLV